MRTDENTELDLPLELTYAERISPLWIKISTEIEKKLAALRIKNDNDTLSEGETAVLRGQIRSYKAILGLGNEMPPLE
jgi:hypothetical protein